MGERRHLAFLDDSWFVAGLLLVSARQALRVDDTMDPKWRRWLARGREAVPAARTCFSLKEVSRS
jgi:hypothetical protein